MNAKGTALNQSSTAVATPAARGFGDRVAVMAVTENPATVDTLQAAAAALDGGNLEFLHSNDPTQLSADGPGSGVVLIVLQCHADANRAKRELGLLHGLAGSAPVVLVDNGDAGLSPEEAVAAGAWDLVALDDRELLQRRLRQAFDIGRMRSELLDSAQRLNQAQRRLDVLLSQGQDARATLIGTRMADPSPAFARLIGINDTETARGTDLLERIAPHDRARFHEALDQVASTHTDTALVFDITTHLNHRQSVRALLKPGVAEKEGERRTIIVLQPRDGEHSVAEPMRAPTLDGRMALHSVLSQTVTRAKEWVPGLLFIVVDEIAALQDQLGLAESDLLLQEVGLYLLQSLRGEDRVFRFGAGEYVMLVERHSATEIEECAQQLHVALSNEIFGDERRSASLSASMAYCVLSGGAFQNDSRLHMLMDKAYELRENGGNACRQCVVESGASAGGLDQDDWVQRLRDALAQDRFSLAYQGITSLAGDSQPYFDVLLRYVDDRGALVRPGEFMPAAEKADMMPDIDRWVVQRAIDVVGQQQAHDTYIALFVKLSAATLQHADAFHEWLVEIVQQRKIDPQSLIFSFREDEVRNQAHLAGKLSESLQESGFRIALTHYGSTPKAVQVLDSMPASFIKLAPDFARQMLGRDEDERLAHIIASARERAIPLIAEQIEDANSMARLWQAGVNYVQGHFIQEPDTEALANTAEAGF